jgi:hypothetical protein
LAIPLGLVTPDLWMPEVIPILTAYANAHFPVAAAALLVAAVAVLGGGNERAGVRAALAFTSGAVIGVVLPFAAVSLGGVLFVWLVWERLRGESLRGHATAFAALILGAGPWLAYDLWLSRVHPALAVWTAQNLTPSPPPYEFALAYGLVLILALLGAARARPHTSPGGRLVLTWVVVNALLLYAPFGLQRRLSLGLFFPLAALAALGLQSLSARASTRRLALVAVLVLSLPSTLVLIAGGLGGVWLGQRDVVMTEGEVAAYTWAGDNIPSGALVLADPISGNRLPAFADVRVVYGHPFETPDALAKLDLVESLLAGTMLPTEGRAALEALDVAYVLYVHAPRTLAGPAWLGDLERIYDTDEAVIYRVQGP